MNNLLMVLLLVLVSTQAIFSQESSTTEDGVSSCQGYWELSYQHSYLDEADSLWEINLLDPSYQAYTEAARQLSLEGNWRGVVKARNRLAEYYRMNAQFDSTISILNQNIKLIEQYLEGDSVEVAEVYFLLGVCYDWDRKLNRSLEAHNQAINIRIQLYGENHFDVARGYAAIGDMYGYLDQLEPAINFLSNAVDILNKLGCENSLRAGKTYYSLASAYRGLADYERANIYGSKALAILADHSSGDRARCNLLLGNINFQIDNFEDALQFFFRAMHELQTKNRLSRNEELNLANMMNSVGSTHLELQQYDSALWYHYKSLNRYQEFGSEDDITIVYQNLGINYSIQGKYHTAKVYLQKAVESRRQEYGDKNFRTSTSLRFLGDHFERMNELDSALTYYQQAVVAGSGENFRSLQVADNPGPSDFVIDGSLLNALWKKGKALRARYDRDLDVNDLINSLETLQVAIELMDSNQDLYELEGSSLLMSSDFYEIFEAALNDCYTLYQASDDPEYLATAFLIMEKSKARLLYDTFSGLALSQQVGIPDSITNKENAIKSELALHTKDLDQELATTPRDPDKIANLEERVFQSNRALEQLHEYLAAAYPAYISSTRSELMSLSTVQQRLSEEKKGLISYFWGEVNLYSLVVNRDAITIHQQPIDTVQKWLDKYQKHLQDGPQFVDQAARFQAFTIDAHRLYQHLFHDIELIGKGQSLIIATDGPLRFIPFEALVEKLPEQYHNDYSQLNYLLQTSPISYIYSANLWALQSKKEAVNMKTLGFSYSSNKESSRGSNELPGAAREIEILQGQLDGLFLSGTEATKQSFLQHAQDYSIIHLAIHGVSDSISRLNNRLLFRNPSDPDKTEPLYTYELYNLRLNSRLAVLSACESGIGKNFQGEGVYSMSRAFSYAGCPTTVMSLWRISDKTTPEILENFYSQLSQGQAVDLALQQAKIQYLSDNPQNLSHPAFWAALVVHGNTDELVAPPTRLTLILTLLSVGILLLILYRQARRKSYRTK
jgi:CHAT domain-containing protein